MGVLEDSQNDIGCWNLTTCINSNNLNLIEQGISNIFKKEGFRRISKPPLPTKNPKLLLKELLSHPWQMNSLWVIGLFSSNFGWTVIKTNQDKLFCRRAKNAIRPRLSSLTTQIGCDAFVSYVQNPYTGALLEANTSGQIFVSGYLDNSNYREDNDVFCYEPVNKLSCGLNFHLLNVAEELKTINNQNNSQKERQAREQELEELVEKYPKKINYALSEYKKIHQSRFIRDEENLRQLLSCPDFFWYERNLLYKAYAEPEQLEENRLRLLFFQVGRFNINPDTEKIWSPITSRKDYGIVRDIPW